MNKAGQGLKKEAANFWRKVSGPRGLVDPSEGGLTRTDLIEDIGRRTLHNCDIEQIDAQAWAVWR